MIKADECLGSTVRPVYAAFSENISPIVLLLASQEKKNKVIGINISKQISATE